MLLWGALLLGAAAAAWAGGDAPAAPNGGWGAVWSPRGEQLAFLSSPDGLPTEAWVCDREGQRMRRVTHGGADELAWSKEGRALRFSTLRRGRLERWVVDLQTGAERPEPTPAHVPPGARWQTSPDGRLVAYVPEEGEHHDLFLLLPGQAKPVPVTGDFDLRSFVWSPRSDAIAFDGTNPLSHGFPQVWAYRLSTKKLAHLGSAGSYGPVWSAAGDRLAYRVLYSGAGDRIATATPDGKLGKLIKGVLSRDDALSWGPRKGVLTVAAQGEKQREVWVVTPEGAVKQKLSRPGLAMRNPAWSPDGTRLAVEGLQEGTSAASEVWVTDAAGTQWRNLTPSHPSVWGLSLSRQDRLFFLSNPAGAPRIRAAGAGDASALSRLVGVRRVVAAPAGDRLAVLLADSLALYAPDGTALGTQVVPRASHLQWSPQGDRLAVEVTTSRGDAALKLFSVLTDGTLTATGGLAGRSPAWRADGTALAFVRGTELWQADREGAHEARLATLPAAEGEVLEVRRLCFGPSGDALAATATRVTPAGAQQEVWVVRGGEPSKVLAVPVTTEFDLAPDRYNALPAWTADGRILFASDREGSPQVWSVRPDGSDLQAITPANSAWAALTPEGNALDFVRLDQDAPLWKVSTDGSGLSPVASPQP